MRRGGREGWGLSEGSTEGRERGKRGIKTDSKCVVRKRERRLKTSKEGKAQETREMTHRVAATAAATAVAAVAIATAAAGVRLCPTANW